MSVPQDIVAGKLELPILTLERSAWQNNLEALLAYCRAEGVLIAPHAKTAMIPEIARAAVERGAWGASTADVRQTETVLHGGVERVIIANQVVGAAALDHLSVLMRAFPSARICVFVDSTDGAKRLQDMAVKIGKTVEVLVELGVGRGGLRTLDAAKALAELMAGMPNLNLSGVACYEGAAARADPSETGQRIGALLDMTADFCRWLQAKWPERSLIMTAGGSLYFDMVTRALAPVAREIGNVEVILRSGALVFHDHGVYERGAAALKARGGAGIAELTDRLRPALRVWADVLSRPETGLAIVGAGMRHLPFDQGLPVVVGVHRNGRPLQIPHDGLSVKRLNDQHAFIEVSKGGDIAVGDVLEFGISHPCTGFDRWRQVVEIDGEDVIGVRKTHF